jgi:transposase-like protein
VSRAVSKLNKRVYEHIEAWRNRPIEPRFPYVYLDGLFMKMSFGDGVHHVAVLVAIGVDDDGYREVLGVCQGGKEDKESCSRSPDGNGASCTSIATSARRSRTPRSAT